jgi:indole-3-glycerol phosphate synthase
MTKTTPDILQRIVDRKREEVAVLHRQDSLANWRARAADTPSPPDFLAALRGQDRIRVIAEIKKASPSAGVIRPDFDPPAIAASYHAHGAACISVLTDQDFFQGSIAHLRRVAQSVPLPILRKDFIIDPAQIFEARVAGAAGVLLIAECLDGTLLGDLLAVIESLKMTALVELHDAENLPRVIASGARLIGINNRDLRTFETHLDHTLTMLREIPGDRTVVSESGIRTHADVERLHAAGVHAILVGEAFMRSKDPGAKLAELVGNAP